MGGDWTTLVHQAVWKDDPDGLSLLLDNGAEVDAPNQMGDSPLHEIIGEASTEETWVMLDILIEHGASLELHDVLGQSPLMDACDRSKPDMIRFLANRRVDMTALAPLGETPLSAYLRARVPKPEVYADMVRMGSDPTVADMHGVKPLSLTLPLRNFASFVLNGGVDIHALGPIRWDSAAYSFNWTEKNFRLFQRRFPEPRVTEILNMEAQGPWTPLCIFAAQGRKEIVEGLLSCGAAIDFDGCPYGTALDAACQSGHLGMVKVLVRRGATLSAPDKRSHSTVFRAKGYPKILQWLLVDRFTEQRKLKDGDAAAGPGDSPLKPWSGTTCVEWPLAGDTRRKSWEALQNYLIRLERLRTDLRGKVALTVPRRQPDWAAPLWPREPVRIHPEDTRRPRDCATDGPGQ
ncbi:ankyrin [Thozetella sp. PMI_491]|nr:ankyrin [Thozetella sp. PMI_491]